MTPYDLAWRRVCLLALSYRRLRDIVSRGKDSSVPSSFADKCTDVACILSNGSMSPGDVTMLRGRAASVINHLFIIDGKGPKPQDNAVPLSPSEVRFVNHLMEADGVHILIPCYGGVNPLPDALKLSEVSDGLNCPIRGRMPDFIRGRESIKEVEGSTVFSMVCSSLGLEPSYNRYEDKVATSESGMNAAVRDYVLISWAVLATLFDGMNIEGEEVIKVGGTESIVVPGSSFPSVIICSDDTYTSSALGDVAVSGNVGNMKLYSCGLDFPGICVSSVLSTLSKHPEATVAVETGSSELDRVATIFGNRCIRMRKREILRLLDTPQ